MSSCYVLCYAIVYIYTCVYIYIYYSQLWTVYPDRFLPFFPASPSLPGFQGQVSGATTGFQRQVSSFRCMFLIWGARRNHIAEILLKIIWSVVFWTSCEAVPYVCWLMFIPMNYRLVCIIKPGWPSYWSYVYQLSHSKLGHCRSKMAQYGKYR